MLQQWLLKWNMILTIISFICLINVNNKLCKFGFTKVKQLCSSKIKATCPRWVPPLSLIYVLQVCLKSSPDSITHYTVHEHIFPSIIMGKQVSKLHSITFCFYINSFTENKLLLIFLDFFSAIQLIIGHSDCLKTNKQNNTMQFSSQKSTMPSYFSKYEL